jgi:hypothetical protein
VKDCSLFRAGDTYVVDLIERPEGEYDPHKSLRVHIRQFRTILRRKRSLNIEVGSRYFRIDPNKSNDDNKNQDQELHRSEDIIDNDAPSSRDGMEHAAERIGGQRYCDDLSWRSLSMRCVEDILSKGDCVMRRIFEHYEADSEKACGEEKGLFQHVVKLERIAIRF